MKHIREGDLYKIINIDGIKFVIKYGYYDEKERHSKYNEPIPIYPNFNEKPQYSKCGKKFVTQMEDKCKYYDGDKNHDSCNKCKYFISKEDLIGLCNHNLNKQKKGE